MKQIIVSSEKELKEKYASEIYTILDKEGEALFDVLQEDFYEMVNEALVDEETQMLLEENTDWENLQEEYGVDITIDPYAVKNIKFLNNDTVSERKIVVELCNGTEITIESCYESWQQYGGTNDELQSTMGIANRFNAWLHGEDLY